jgi:hypothetical protein
MLLSGGDIMKVTILFLVLGLVLTPALTGQTGASVAPPIQARPLFSFTLTQSVPGGAVTVMDLCGHAQNYYVNLASSYAVDFPSGPMFGIDLTVNEALNEVYFGEPFFGVLDITGHAEYVVQPPLPLPAGYTIYCVGIEFDRVSHGIVSVTEPFSFTIQ